MNVIVSLNTIVGLFARYLLVLPNGSEERDVLGVGSIPVAILTSCQDMETIAL